MKQYNFPCGCKFDVIEETGDTVRIGLNPDLEELPLTCQRTWDFISAGDTKGVFQLEKQGHAAKKLQPNNMEHLSALIAIIRPGCISWDTLVVVRMYTPNNRGGNYCFVRKRISDIYQQNHKRSMEMGGRRYTDIVSYNEDTGKLEYNRLINVMYSGIKKTYKIKLRKNLYEKNNHNDYYDLRCTSDHPLLTPYGWVKLEDMRIGDRFAVLRTKGTVKARLNLDGEKGFRNRCFQHYEKKCIFCDWNEASLDVNHIDGNRKNDNSPDNLCFMCPNHHRMYTDGKITKAQILQCRKLYVLPQKEDIVWAEYLGKEFVAEEDTYDIEMLGPHHNFIAGNVIVHNCAESIIDGKSVTQHYIDRKHGREEVTYYHPALIPALKSTYGLLVYQEQAMQIVKDIAGFNLLEADNLRKAIGKKKPEEMAKIKTMFLEKAKELNIVSEEEAAEIFSWIEKSQRYSFNKSHSISYAYNAYLSAYCKAHFIRPFFTSYLFYSKDKAKQTLEIKELVNNAKMLNVVISTPDFRRLITASRVAGLNPSAHFMLRDKVVYVGFSDIKGVGEAAISKLLVLVPFLELMLEKPYTEWDWTEFLIYCSPHLSSDVVKALIQAGTFSYMGLSRTRMIYEYDALKKLSEKELLWICEHRGPTLSASLEKMVNCGAGRDKGISNKNRLVIVGDIITSLDNPSYSMDDAADWVAGIEESLLGISLTCTKVDGRDTASANCTCKEFADGKRGYVIIGAQVTNVNEIKTKRGENAGQRMAFITLSDTTGSIDNIVAFPETWSECKGLLVSGNLILLGGERGKDNSLIVKKVWQM